jgi:L,D-peptidoglycan transpeptidase YkuD (ErfK/YbiS/YcfS/YnhG family)
MARRLAPVALFAILAGCSGSSDAKTAVISSTTTSPTTTSPTTTSPTASSAAATTSTPVPAPPATTPPARAQTIVVSSSGYGQSSATFSAYDQTGSGWVRRFGPWSARVGRNGFAPGGDKREGDGRTPSGTYGFAFLFGINANPGVSFPYRQVTGQSIVWDDDPASTNYNRWIDTRVGDAGRSPEPMYNAPFYNYGAVIAYNTARSPGLGSAIFLHVSNGGSTAGCVALPQTQLLDVLRWLEPGLNPQIRMGVDLAAPA